MQNKESNYIKIMPSRKCLYARRSSSYSEASRVSEAISLSVEGFSPSYSREHSASEYIAAFVGFAHAKLMGVS